MRRDGPSKRWNFATFWSTKALGVRAGVAVAVAVSEDETSSPEIADEEELENSPPNEIIRMSKDTCAEK